MSDAPAPEPEERGRKVPPPRVPPVATGAAAASPAPGGRRADVAELEARLRRADRLLSIALRVALVLLVLGAAMLVWSRVPLGRAVGLCLLIAGAVPALILFVVRTTALAVRRREARRLRQPG